MISIARHIELLLLDHDCVIVPGLGAFIANQASANYNEYCDYMFLPPYRNIRYNQNLITNDGLLVQSYMNAYDAAYPEALKQLNQDVADVLDELDINGEYLLKGVGTIYKGVNGVITFTQEESGILTPSLYGLYSFSAKSWEEILKEKQIKETLKQTIVIPISTTGNTQQIGEDSNISTKDTEPKNRTKLIDISVAAVASILLFFLFSYPAFKSVSTTDNTYIASSISIKNVNANNNKAITPINNAKTSNIVIDEENIVEPVTHTAIDSEKNFVIVLATCVTQKNANELIEKMKKDGYSDVIFDDSGKMNRVTFSSFATFKEANDELTTLRHLSPYFKEAWVYNKK